MARIDAPLSGGSLQRHRRMVDYLAREGIPISRSACGNLMRRNGSNGHLTRKPRTTVGHLIHRKRFSLPGGPQGGQGVDRFGKRISTYIALGKASSTLGGGFWGLWLWNLFSACTQLETTRASP